MSMEVGSVLGRDLRVCIRRRRDWRRADGGRLRARVQLMRMVSSVIRDGVGAEGSRAAFEMGMVLYGRRCREKAMNGDREVRKRTRFREQVRDARCDLVACSRGLCVTWELAV